MPGYPFGVFAGIQDVTKGGAPADNIEVALELYPWDGKTNPTANSDGTFTFSSSPVGVSLLHHLTPTYVKAACSFISVRGGTNPGCEFSLPSIGIHDTRPFGD